MRSWSCVNRSDLNSESGGPCKRGDTEHQARLAEATPAARPEPGFTAGPALCLLKANPTWVFLRLQSVRVLPLPKLPIAFQGTDLSPFPLAREVERSHLTHPHHSTDGTRRRGRGSEPLVEHSQPTGNQK